ncbi:MAG: molecular chaperone DnaJ [Gammaproteobacteria bacterium]
MAERRWQIEPLGRSWSPRPVTANRQSSGMFRASWADTLKLLLFEVGELGGTGAVAIQLDADPADIRQDGMLRARARAGDFPGVIVSFASKHGPLSYATDAYEQRWSGDLTGWQANVRAIALALVALRAVDRYGVSRRGEQYTGWKALPAGNGGAPSHMTREAAIRCLARLAGQSELALVADDAATRTYRLGAWRKARAAAHPDRHGGDRTAWDEVERAARVLGLDGGSHG